MNKVVLIAFVCISTFLFGQSKGDVTLNFKDQDTKIELPFIKLKLVELNKPFITDISGIVKLTNFDYNSYSIELDSHLYIPYQFNFKINTPSQIINFKTTSKIKHLQTVEVIEEGGDGTIRKMRSIEGVLISQGKKTEVITVDKIAGNKAVGLGRQIY